VCCELTLKICSYEHASGREAVLEMLHDILTRFPQRIIDDQGQTFFLNLVVALANEQHQNVSSMILRTIQKLLGRIGDQGKKSIFEYSLSWYTGEKQNLWSASAQVNYYFLISSQTLNATNLKSSIANGPSICFYISSGEYISTSICYYCIFFL
jgi:U3 small nucleolar RNA-associated protein 20